MTAEPKHAVAKAGVGVAILRDDVPSALLGRVLRRLTGFLLPGRLRAERPQVLLGLRTGAHGAGEWAFPGGKIDWGEDPLSTALREIEEECGVVVDEESVEELGWTNDVFPDDGLHFITLYFRCRWKSGEPQILEPHKCLEWRWFPVDELPEPRFEGLDNLLARYGALDR